VASHPMEYTGILARSANPRPMQLAADWARTARIGNHDALLVANGAGARRAAAAVDAALAVFEADAVVSTGFCGALVPGLAIADVVVANSIASGGRRFPTSQPACPAPHHTGVICSIDHVAQTAREKSGLRASGGAAVEMEAAGVAEQTATRGLPFYCIRVVTDLAGEDIANDFNGALRPDGHFATMLILRGAVRHPWDRLPELMRLRRRSVRAACVLGDFVADCRF
jgi:adenosylhomocysteine nucleosidase